MEPENLFGPAIIEKSNVENNNSVDIGQRLQQ